MTNELFNFTDAKYSNGQNIPQPTDESEELALALGYQVMRIFYQDVLKGTDEEMNNFLVEQTNETMADLTYSREYYDSDGLELVTDKFGPQVLTWLANVLNKEVKSNG